MKKLIILVLALAATMGLYYCGPKPAEVPTVVDNGPAMKARFTTLNNCFNTGNVEAIDTLLSENVVDHTEDTTMHLPKGPAGLKAMIGMMREGVPDLKSEVTYMVAEGNMLMVYGTTSGTNTGPMMGMPPTGKAFSAPFVDIVKFDSDLKMTDHWGVYDNLKMMTDMGMVLGPPQPEKKGKK